MKKHILLLVTLISALACNDTAEPKIIATPDPVDVNSLDVSTISSERVEELAESLKQQGYQTFLSKEGDSTYLMQQYFIVFLRSGENRDQDSLEAAQLQEKHMAHLNRMAEEGYSSLTGPFGGEGEIRGAVIYNTATQEEADSLAKLDPMVQAGRLKVEVHPWWILKGAKLN